MAGTIEFKIEQTNIPGLLVISMDTHQDPRGWFTEKFQKAKLVALGFPEEFNPTQHSLSYNKDRGVTRGLHAEPWDKYVNVIKGKVFAAYVDLREGPTYGQKFETIIDENKAIFIPRGVANSFQSLEPDTYYNYLTNGFWSPEAKYTLVNVADPDLAINWPIPLSEAIISDKDSKHPFLKDIK